VPVAVNLYQVRQARDEGGELFRSVQRQRPQYQGVWIISPDGKVLAAHKDNKEPRVWTAEILQAINAGLEAFGDVPPRPVTKTDPLPYRGVGVRPDGSVTLALYVRYNFNGQVSGQGVRDSLTLPEEEWSALGPPEAVPGRSWTPPGQLARKLGRCLSPQSDQSTMPRPEEVTSVRLNGKVVSVKGGVATLAYEGHLAAAHKNPFDKGKVSRSSARLQGTGRYDVRRGQLLSVVLVLDGVYHMFPPYDAEARPTVAGVEWRLHRPAR
jgi:hypothetical protein